MRKKCNFKRQIPTLVEKHKLPVENLYLDVYFVFQTPQTYNESDFKIRNNDIYIYDHEAPYCYRVGHNGTR